MSANAWLFLGTVLAALITGYFSLRVARTGHAANQETLTAAPYDSMVKEVADLRTEIREQSSRIARQSDRITSQDKRIATLEFDQGVLVAALAEQHEWQLAGAKPPPPGISSAALALLRRHMAQRATDHPPAGDP